MPSYLFAQDKTKKSIPITFPKTAFEAFSYSAQDRRDPFEIIYKDRIVKPSAVQQQKSGYELEELKVVGVLKTGDVKFAIMEDVQGRGLFFKKGDFINNTMWVLDILENKIILGHRLRGDIRKIQIDIPRKQEG
jgi:Tfp pilus assembly protein PilP